MFDDEIAARIRDDRERDGYLFPDYGRYCFAGVPATLGGVLGVDLPGDPLPDGVVADVPGLAGTAPGDDADYDRVCHVLVDGFGYEQWRREVAADRAPAWLADLAETARVRPLTSVYPSETAAAITTVHTGRTPVEHGVIGWDMYLPEVDRVIQTLPFTTKSGEAADEASGVDAADLFAGGSVYETLAAEGIDSVTVQPTKAATGAYSAHALAGADSRGYEDLDGFRSLLTEAVADSDPGTYCYAYLSDVDGAAHEAGTDSAHYRETLTAVAEAVEAALSAVPEDVAASTLFVLTADHGHVDTDHETNVDLWAHEYLTERMRRYETGAPPEYPLAGGGGDEDRDWNGAGDGGDPLPPVGGARNVHLHLRPGTTEEVIDYLDRTFDGRAFTREEAFDRGLFGDRGASDRFRRRCGDVVFVHRRKAVWRGDEPGKLDYVGWHGGLTPAEMLTPFAAAPLSDVT
ncbi:alkaline phosphatase family protein [Halobaculum gomorrense]|uniref:Type I phosphodiesterase / nucleotide pyrophosphatase n=1 Tax=Halobaculum gomorrense TaxID=43928 RepID=A0A1M5QGL2_9EURY|nr:alkaline phosphatase family protein [Halobaculum gomorrense]SHH13068.1 Type I phosphodiesterase / nucleotide pyrophosphatase [Halobaculum gomorrense]